MRCRATGAILFLLAGCSGLASAGEGVVYFADLESFSPRSAISDKRVHGKWYLRRVRWTEHAQGLLNLAGTAEVPDLTCSPGLRGRYNVYVGCRQVGSSTVFQVRIGDDDTWYTINPGIATGQRHFNKEILLARNVDMTGKKLTLHAVSRAIYFYYFKFVRPGRDTDAKVEAAMVKREPRRADTATAEMEARIKSGYFVQRHYVDDKPLPELTDTHRRLGFAVFRCHYLNLIFPNTVPLAQELTGGLEAFATPGEFEPVSFAVRALRALTDVTVTVSDLQGPRGAVLPADVFDVRVVRCLRKRSTAYRGRSEFMDVPILLEKRPRVEVRANQTKQFWLTVRVPENAAPGRYRGEVTVGPPAGKQRVPLVLDVLPIRLPDEPKNHMLGMYDCPPREMTPLIERFRDMREHGMTTVASSGKSGLRFHLEDGKVTVAFDGSRLERVLRTHGRFFTKPLYWPMGRDIHQWCVGQEKRGGRYRDLYVQIIRQIADYCAKQNLPGIIFQPEDECTSVEANEASFPIAIRQLKALKAAGAATEMDHMAFRYAKRPKVDAMVQQAMPLTDVLTLRYTTRPMWYEQTWDELASLCAKHGKALWTYNIHNGVTFPEPTSNRFSTGFFFHTLGKACTGEFYWAYQYPFGGLYEDLHGDWGNFMWRYPPDEPNGEVGGPTIMWECLREGVDDLRYIEKLTDLIEKAGRTAPGAAGKARAVLADVLSSFDFGEMKKTDCRFIESKWEKSFTLPDGRRACSGRFRFPNGWSAEDYDRARRRIADAIVALQKALDVER
jgi:hypothetical protein